MTTNNVSPDQVAAAYQAILCVPPPGGASGSYATLEAAQIDEGLITFGNFESSVYALDQTIYTTLPALVTIAAFYINTPSSAELTTVATATSGTSYDTATEFHNIGYSDANVWTILGDYWGADPNSDFYQMVDSLATGTTADYATFINEAYQQAFDVLPSATNLQYLLNDIPGVSALLSSPNHVATPIQIMGGLFGYLLYAGQTSGTGYYATSGGGFLLNAGVNAAAGMPSPYGSYLEPVEPGGPPITNSVTVTASGQSIDPGTGTNAIQFVAGTSQDTLVLAAGALDEMSGFNPETDILDLSSVLAQANITPNDISSLGSYVNITAEGANVSITIEPTSPGNNGAFAMLSGVGPGVTTLEALITPNAAPVKLSVTW